MSKTTKLESLPKGALREVLMWLQFQGKAWDDDVGARKSDLAEVLARRLRAPQVRDLASCCGDRDPFFTEVDLAKILGLPQNVKVLGTATKQELQQVMRQLDREGRCGVAWSRWDADGIREYLNNKLSQKEVVRRLWGLEMIDGARSAEKEADLGATGPSARTRDYEYDVALSFAGEDRRHAKMIADGLKSRGAKVFYDKYEQAALWGKNLYEHLREVYSNKARFCVLFVSRHYAEKVWTSHEHQSAQERALRERGREYILPIQIDDTKLPGLSRTVGYVDMSVGVDTIVGLLMQKLAT